MNDEHLREFYTAFNARDIDAAMAGMSDDVDWPNGWEGGRVQGREAVRSYWSRQWDELDPRVEPGTISTRTDDRIAVDVHQVVRDKTGEVVSDGHVRHIYELRDGLVARMDIEDLPAAH